MWVELWCEPYRVCELDVLLQFNILSKYRRLCFELLQWQSRKFVCEMWVWVWVWVELELDFWQKLTKCVWEVSWRGVELDLNWNVCECELDLSWNGFLTKTFYCKQFIHLHYPIPLKYLSNTSQTLFDSLRKYWVELDF